MFQSIKTYCDKLTNEFDLIPKDRKELLNKISQYIIEKQKQDKAVNLVYICTHNSRRSHFGQIWSRVAANYYKIENINSYSGGTEATAFNINAINALKRIGFKVETGNEQSNALYNVLFASEVNPVICFSKVYDDPVNPREEFAAIMTCGEAEENCPFIPGAELRVATTYADPKAFDDTSLQDSKYDERCEQIARDTLYVFSNINKQTV